MRDLVLKRLYELRDHPNGFGPETMAPTYWEGLFLNGKPYGELVLESLSDSELLHALEGVIRNFEYMERH